MTTLTFSNYKIFPKDECGCTMEYTSGEGLYSEAHEITLCEKHDAERLQARVAELEEIISSANAKVDNAMKLVHVQSVKEELFIVQGYLNRGQSE